MPEDTRFLLFKKSISPHREWTQKVSVGMRRSELFGVLLRAAQAGQSLYPAAILQGKTAFPSKYLVLEMCVCGESYLMVVLELAFL